MAADERELERELAALAQWAAFPAWRDPRPVVLTGTDRVQFPALQREQHEEAALAGAFVVLSFIGGPRVYTDYGPPLRVHSSGGAVVVSDPTATDLAGPGARLRYAEVREVTVELPAPLGNRVLVDPSGAPIPVLP